MVHSRLDSSRTHRPWPGRVLRPGVERGRNQAVVGRLDSSSNRNMAWHTFWPSFVGLYKRCRAHVLGFDKEKLEAGGHGVLSVGHFRYPKCRFYMEKARGPLTDSNRRFSGQPRI
ncbi:hypothetical protein CGRA01v4_13028 [Colletotrichum graminicola]|nr:hypothetical protein CGRA01v4_13028 [Colletotrichum graminicola]